MRAPAALGCGGFGFSFRVMGRADYYGQLDVRMDFEQDLRLSPALPQQRQHARHHLKLRGAAPGEGGWFGRTTTIGRADAAVQRIAPRMPVPIVSASPGASLLHSRFAHHQLLPQIVNGWRGYTILERLQNSTAIPCCHPLRAVRKSQSERLRTEWASLLASASLGPTDHPKADYRKPSSLALLAGPARADVLQSGVETSTASRQPHWVRIRPLRRLGSC